MNKKTTVILISFFLCVSIVNVSLAQEQISGRIIEINRDLDVVFINKGKEFLNIGDIVKIYDGGQFISYLKVVQILEKVAALSSFQDAKVGSEMISFEEITVGNTFVKADKEDYEKKEKHKSKEGMKPSFFQEVPGTEKQEDKTGYEEKTKTREIEEN
ncbi:MAG: hypothetical protein KAI70_02190, partial [Candidatus Omnitrophica bacterium]|nr:hypothetical protein [Candidatus Omnitrophota bacterium]